MANLSEILTVTLAVVGILLSIGATNAEVVPGADISQFIGAKVSVFLKSGARYDGTLYAVDEVETIITLFKVIHENEIYDFQRFRFSDIRSFDILEPPPPPAEE